MLTASSKNKWKAVSQSSHTAALSELPRVPKPDTADKDAPAVKSECDTSSFSRPSDERSSPPAKVSGEVHVDSCDGCLVTCLQCCKPLGNASGDARSLHLDCVDLYRSLSAQPQLHEGEHQGIVCSVDAERGFGFLCVPMLHGNVHFSFRVLPSSSVPKCKEAFAVEVRPTSKGFTATSMRNLGKKVTLAELEELARKCREEIIRAGRFVDCPLVERLMCQKLGVSSLSSIGVVNPRLQIA